MIQPTRQDVGRDVVYIPHPDMKTVGTLVAYKTNMKTAYVRFGMGVSREAIKMNKLFWPRDVQ